MKESLNIGFDAKRAFYNSSGLGNYSRNLITALINNFPQHQYHLFSPGFSKSDFHDFVSKQANVKLIEPPSYFPSLINAPWRTFIIPNKLKKLSIQLYHGLSAELPEEFCNKKKTAKVVTIHDLIFIRYPKLYSKTDSSFYSIKTRKACKSANGILAVSNQTSNDLQEFLKVPGEKITVIYQCCNPIFYNSVSAEQLQFVKKKYNLSNEFILNVGTLEERKNSISLIESVAKMKNPLPIVFIGKETGYMQHVKQSLKKNNMEKQVIFLKDISNFELSAIYRLATISAYPSIFEGFGIPVLESIVCGTPVIAHFGSSLPEAGGEAAMYCNTNNVDEFLHSLNQLIYDEQIRNDFKDKMKIHAEKMSPDNFAKNTMIYYEQILGK